MKIANVLVLLVVNVQGNHLRVRECGTWPAAFDNGLTETNPRCERTSPCPRGCRCIANGGALNAVGADYDGVIRLAAEKPDHMRRSFWAGAARHYCAPGAQQ